MRRLGVTGWIVVALAALGATLGLLYAIYEVTLSGEASAAIPPTSTAPTGPVTLAVGTIAPPFEAEGWLNGAPPPRAAAGPKLVVADLWALW